MTDAVEGVEKQRRFPKTPEWSREAPLAFIQTTQTPSAGGGVKCWILWAWLIVYTVGVVNDVLWEYNHNKIIHIVWGTW